MFCGGGTAHIMIARQANDVLWRGLLSLIGCRCRGQILQAVMSFLCLWTSLTLFVRVDRV